MNDTRRPTLTDAIMMLFKGTDAPLSAQDVVTMVKKKHGRRLFDQYGWAGVSHSHRLLKAVEMLDKLVGKGRLSKSDRDVWPLWTWVPPWDEEWVSEGNGRMVRVDPATRGLNEPSVTARAGRLVALVALVGMLLALAVGSSVLTGGGAAVADPAVSGPTVVTVGGPGPVTCEESERCWNSCTFGVDGRYLESDVRHWAPGPCEFGNAVLPFGGTFAVDSVPLPAPAGVVCGDVRDGWRYASVTVSVRNPDGSVRPESPVSGQGCVPESRDQVGAALNEVMPELYRIAAGAGR
jgi:hypothetical protein